MNCTEKDGCDPSYGSLVNLAIRETLAEPGSHDGTIWAVGVWLGDQIASSAGYEWVTLTDDYGPCICVFRFHNDDGNQWIDPFNLVAKRLENGEIFDARGLVEKLIALDVTH